MLWIVEVDDQEAAFDRSPGKLFPPLPPDSNDDQDHAEEDERRQDEPDDQVRIGMGAGGHRLDDRQEDNESDVECRNEQAGERDRIGEDLWEPLLHHVSYLL